MSVPDPTLESVLQDTDWLRRLARSLLQDAHRAEDAVQETLLTALEWRGEGRSSLRGWLATVLKNRVRQEERARGRREAREDRVRSAGAPPEGDVPDVVSRLELQTLVLEAVRGLEEPYRSTIVQRFFDGLAPSEIAGSAGIPVKTVNTRLERGLAKLRARLDGRFGGDRGTWVRALLPFAGPSGLLPWSGLGEGIAMGQAWTGMKITAAVALVLGAAWLAREVLAPAAGGEGVAERPAGAPVSGAPVPARDDGQGRGASPSEPVLAEPSVRQPLAVAREHASSAPGAPGPATAVLLVNVVKRNTGVPPTRAELRITEASPAVGGGSALLGDVEPLGEASTDASGRARFELPARRALWVAVDAGRWGPAGGSGRVGELEPLRDATVQIEPLAPGEERALRIELEHGDDRVFLGQVVAREEGRALAGALVDLRPPWGQPIEADAAGLFEIPYPSWDPPWRIEVRRSGYSSRYLEIAHEDQVPGLPTLIALERAALIAASVAGGGDKRLELRARSGERTASAALDSAGGGELEVEANEELVLELLADERIVWSDPEPWRLAPGERRELVHALGAGVLVHGFLRDAGGAPLADRELWARAARAEEGILQRTRFLAEGADEEGSVRTKTDGQGRFEFTDLVPGAWWIGPAGPGTWWKKKEADPDALAALAIGVELLPGELVRRVDLVAHRGLWIQGRVLGEDGRVIGHASVHAARTADDAMLQALSDERGEFVVGPLGPGEYSLRGFGDGAVGWNKDPLIVEAGAQGVDLVLRARNAIGGRLVDEDGRAFAGHVAVLQKGGSLSQSTSDRDPGAFLFVELDPGTWTVCASTPDGRVAVKGVELEDGGRVADLELTLGPGARIGVSHDLERDVRCSIYSGAVLVADWTTRAGQASFALVPEGPTRVDLYEWGAPLAVREVFARAGRVETVAFEVR